MRTFCELVSANNIPWFLTGAIVQSVFQNAKIQDKTSSVIPDPTEWKAKKPGALILFPFPVMNGKPGI